MLRSSLYYSGGLVTQRRNEFDLLCACAGVELGPTRAARIADWSQSSVDWEEFLRLAELHGVLPLVARNLQRHAQGLPSPVDEKLRSAFDANVRRSLWFAGELARIQIQFEKDHVFAIPYKGPTLAELSYGDVALRNFSDLDFLIAPAQFEAARKSLAELGYRPSSELSSSVERYWLRNGYERPFDSAAGKYLVELQWGLLPHFYAVDLRIDDLLARSHPALLGGREVPSLSPEDLLLVLSLHGAKHLWMRLIWVCDIAETLRTQTLDWAVFVAWARKLGVLRMAGVSMWLAQELLDCALPEPAQEVVSGDPEVANLGEAFVTRLERGTAYDFESTEYFRLILKLRERSTDQMRYIWRLLWTPGEGDLAVIRLPEVLFPLYRGVRAVRLIRKIF
ncbi:MAG TPA: nucleotidyltransferase family protein [Terriglobales bacterium]|jgi:hypothetical protein|nr:nucleotidyltransferase family protein [Terriglobales bacterium]